MTLLFIEHAKQKINKERKKEQQANKRTKQKSKAPVNQLVNAEVSSGNRKAVLASSAMKCNLKDIKHCSQIVFGWRRNRHINSF